MTLLEEQLFEFAKEILKKQQPIIDELKLEIISLKEDIEYLCDKMDRIERSLEEI